MNETESVSGLEQQLQGIIEGMPELAGFSPYQRRNMAFTMARQARQGSFSETQTRAMKFLVQKVGDLTEQTKKDLLAGQLIFQDADIYFRKKIAGGGIQLILDSTNTKRVGTAFYDKNFLPDRVNAVLSDIKFAYGYHATKTDPTDITYSTDNTMSGGVGQIPNPIVNGELEISTNDKPVVLLPVSSFVRTGLLVQTTDPRFDFHALQGMRLIKEQVPININLKVADSLTLSTSTNHFVDITLRTVITKTR